MTRSKPNRRKRLLVSFTAAAVMALGVLAPTASAEPNTGTVAKGETRATTQQCDMYKKWHDDDLAAKPPDTKGAAYTKDLADRRGCNWAEAATAPGPRQPVFRLETPYAEPGAADEDLSQDLPWAPTTSITESVLSP